MNQQELGKFYAKCMHICGLPWWLSWERTHLPMQETQEITGLIPGPGRFPGGGHDNPLQNSCLENPSQRNLPSYGSLDHKELETTEAT